ncbi:MAG TPA: YceI family protein [Gammaproteobacteria bacterium]
MPQRKFLNNLVAVVLLALPLTAAAGSQSPPVPAGTYTLDPAHASLLFRVDHLGFSNYTAHFTRFDATLQFDPANPAASSVTATVDATSIETHYPEPEKHDFNAQLQNERWLDTAKFPVMTFQSRKVEATGPNTVRIHGVLELRGVKQPVILEATYNGGYAGHPLDPHARIGFSARGTLRRSDFGMSFGIPTEKMPLGVGDAVDIIIEAEFNGPPLPDAASGATGTSN